MITPASNVHKRAHTTQWVIVTNVFEQQYSSRVKIFDVFFLYKNRVKKIEKLFNMIYFVIIIFSMEALLYFDAVQRDMPFRRTLNTILIKHCAGISAISLHRNFAEFSSFYSLTLMRIRSLNWHHNILCHLV